MKQYFPPCEEPADETLCARAASGEALAEELLLTRYSRLVRACARPYFLEGGDSEDLIQEGMVGLLKAIREYDGVRDAKFRTYAEICIRNRLFSAIKAAARDKHIPLNRSVSIEAPSLDAGRCVPCYPDHPYQADPEEIMIVKESLRERMSALEGQLSGFECKVLGLYLDGLSYREIALQISRSPKSVDNAVQRIRRKLARHGTFGDISES